MLEDTRKRGATIAIYVIFGILIAVFVLNFGPGGSGQNQGCSLKSSRPVKVTIDGRRYGMPTWQWAENTQPSSGSKYAAARKIQAMDDLIKRELLAQEAERRGLVITGDVIDDRIISGKLFVLTTPLAERPDLGGEKAYFEDGIYFNDKYLERWIGNFGLTLRTFKAEQRRELLAQVMIDELRAGAHVSRDETFALWVHANTDVTLDAVSFKVDDYKSRIVITEADIDRFLKDREADVKKKFEDDKALTYTGTQAKVKLRRVFVSRTPSEDKPADDADGAGSGTGTGTAAPAAKPDPAKVKLEAARADIIAKKKTFAEVAKAMDSDATIAAKSGDLGWVSVDAPGLGNKDVGAAIKTLKAGGEPSAVIDAPDGFWLVAVDEERSGDLTFDQVKREIAATLATERWAREAARRDALAALQGAVAAKDKKLADLYEKAPEPVRPPAGGGDQLEQIRQQIQEEINDPNKSEEEKQRLRELLQQIDSGALGGPQTGRIDYFSPAIPAAWGQDAEGSAAGSAAPVPPVDVKPAVVEDVMAPPSGETLPKFVGVPKATVQTIGPMPRDRELVADLGRSKALIDDAFDVLAEGALAPKIYSITTMQNGIAGGEAFVVVQVTAKGKPDLSKFDEQEASLREGMEMDRGDEIVNAWLKDRCQTLADAGKIKIAQDALLVSEDGEQKVVPYTPCTGLD